jgi:hypothetical protein
MNKRIEEKKRRKDIAARNKMQQGLGEMGQISWQRHKDK